MTPAEKQSSSEIPTPAPRTALLALTAGVIAFFLSSAAILKLLAPSSQRIVDPRLLQTQAIMLNVTTLAALITIAYLGNRFIFFRKSSIPVLLRMAFFIFSTAYLSIAGSFVFTPYAYCAPWLVFVVVGVGASTAMWISATVLSVTREGGSKTVVMSITSLFGFVALTLSVLTRTLYWSEPVKWLKPLLLTGEALFLAVPLVLMVALWFEERRHTDASHFVNQLLLMAPISLLTFYAGAIYLDSTGLKEFLFSGFRIAQLSEMVPLVCMVALALGIGAHTSLLFTNKRYRIEACAGLCWLLAGFAPQTVPNSALAMMATMLIASATVERATT